MTADDVREMLRKACGDAGNQRAWAVGAGISPAYVNDVLKGRREPGQAICDALGLKRVETYEPKR